jgi:hypothetical protein
MKYKKKYLDYQKKLMYGGTSSDLFSQILNTLRNKHMLIYIHEFFDNINIDKRDINTQILDKLNILSLSSYNIQEHVFPLIFERLTHNKSYRILPIGINQDDYKRIHSIAYTVNYFKNPDNLNELVDIIIKYIEETR